MPTGRILAIDYGEKRIGLAMSDPLNITAQGLPTIANDKNTFSSIKSTVENEKVVEIVLGLPRNLNGSIGESAKTVQGFGEELKKYVNIPINYWDEWLSTCEAEKHLIFADKSRKKRKGLIDKVAAQLILQGYLDSLPNKLNY